MNENKKFTSWRKTWSIITPVSSNLVLFYDPIQGEGEFYTKEIRLMKKFTNWRKTWSNIISLNNSLLFYDAQNGESELYDFNMNLIKTYLGWRKTWSQITNIGDNRILFYDNLNGECEFYDYNMNLISSYNGWRKSWSVIIKLGYENILFYDSKNGECELYDFNMCLKSKFYNWRKGWSHIVPISNNEILFYDGENGVGEFYNDRFELIANYEQWRKNWTIITALDENIILFYDKNSGIGRLFNKNVFIENKKFSKYRIKKILGEGYFAKTYLAYDEWAEREVALKIFKENRYPTDDLIKKDILPLLRLNHKNIIKYFESNKINNQYYIALEYANNGTLENYLKKNIDNTNSDNKKNFVKKYFSQILDAVSYCHKNYVIHSDLHSENIFFNNDDEIKIGDFGHAKITEEDFTGSTPKQSLITAPEQDKENLTSKFSDIWMLGILLYRIIYGKIPFSNKLQKSNPNYPKYYSEEFQEYNVIIKKALERDREKRYQSVEEMLKDFQNIKFC